jgi:P27 family predicted phage terminase small subunit
MSKGRVPMPEAYKGNGTQSLSSQVEPCTSVPEPPPWLEDEGLREWHRVAPKLVEMRLLSPIDVMNLGAYCKVYAQWRKCCEQIDRDGAVYLPIAPADYNKPVKYEAHPAVAVADRMLRTVIEISRQFGFTPASRSQIKIARQSSKGEDEFDKFMGD